MAAILQTIFSDAFSWMKSFVFWLKFHWSLFLKVQLTISQLVQIMAWRQIGDKPLSEPMLIRPTDAYMRHKGEICFNIAYFCSGWCIHSYLIGNCCRTYRSYQVNFDKLCITWRFITIWWGTGFVPDKASDYLNQCFYFGIVSEQFIWWLALHQT